MKYAIVIYRFILSQLKDPVFAVALAISVVLWFVNSLSGNFTSVVPIPIVIEGAVSHSEDGVEERSSNRFTVDCKISGKGFNICFYLLVSDITISTSELKIEKEPNGEYVVDMQSLENYLSSRLTGVTLQNIFYKKIAFKSLTYTSKVVPIELDVDIENDGQFMQVGDIVLEPATVVISGTISKLDSINGIKTDYFKIENKEKNISGEVYLRPIDGVKYGIESAYYAINFQRFTEKKITKTVQVKGGGGDRFTIVPFQVEVTLNIAENIYSDFNHLNFPLYVDIRERELQSAESGYIGDNKYILKYQHLPSGVNVRMIQPQYVTILRGGIEGKKETGQEHQVFTDDIFNILEK